MLNTEIANILIAKFGTESFKIYCIMEAEKNSLLAIDEKNRFPDEPTEYDYDASWWANKYTELMNQENH